MGKEFLYETHMHTSEVSCCAVNTAAEQVNFYKERGYTGVIITDHFINGYSSAPPYASWDVKMRHIVRGYEAAREEGAKIGLDVFLGWEFTVRGSDFLTYGLDLDFLLEHQHIDRLSVPAYSALVRRNGGFLAQAHPYRNSYYVEHKLPVDANLLDAVEVYNASEPSHSNVKALAFAQGHDLPIQAGSDSHAIKGRITSGIKMKTKAADIHDIITAIKERNVTLILP